MRIGMSELVVILVVALFVLGPDKLPVYAKKMGEALAHVKDVQKSLADIGKVTPEKPEKEVQKECTEEAESVEEEPTTDAEENKDEKQKRGEL